ncbi:DUF6095 family protein [Flavobacterium beibuense]|uniref:Membrane protein n=1 Tax=Flavobacterium beibuense TaxID=657326 RepID=A0A444WH35_9FLAO|nr:DUF6095 family protein [Flavobacterium beibuense]RYJ45163.1 Membrane protein [Flavobacterium beibuense]
MATDKKILVKGLTYLGWALPMFFLGPVVIHSSFKNQGHPFFIPVLGLGIITCIGAMILMFLGLKTIMKSLFENEK